MTNTERNDIVKLVTTLYDDFTGDSKFKSAAAEKSAIELCEPIIKQYYNFCKKLKVDAKDIFGIIYNADRGGIDGILKFTGEYILFHYTDGRTGKWYETEIKFPIGWLHPQHFEMVFCDKMRRRKVAQLKRHIAGAQEIISRQTEYIAAANAEIEMLRLQEKVGSDNVSDDYSENDHLPPIVGFTFGDLQNEP